MVSKTQDCCPNGKRAKALTELQNRARNSGNKELIGFFGKDYF